ncbi:unnamed protein product [Gadus morhua 'NCC']
MKFLWLDAACLVAVLWAAGPRVGAECDPSPQPPKLNLSVTYDLPTFTADSPIQNMVTLNGVIYVGAVNRIYALSPNLTKLSEYRTGPRPDVEPCGGGPAANGSVDNHNVALLVETIYDQGLFSCGSADRGVCRRHVLDDGTRPKTVDEEVDCFSDRRGRGQPSDPNRVVRPSGARVLNVESNVIHFFAGNSEIPGVTGAPGAQAAGEPHTMSVRKMKTSQNGFTFFSHRSYIDLIPALRGNYFLRYVYSFHSGPFTYFLTVQRAGRGSQAYHTRIVRMCSSDLQIRRYVEMPLQCICTDKRRRRRRGSPSEQGGVRVFNVLQAAHLAKVGPNANLRGVEEGDDVLFAAFARSKPDSPEPTAHSAVCAFPLKYINDLFRKYMQSCNTAEPYHFTGSSNKSCYNVTSSDDCGLHEGLNEGKEGEYRLEVVQDAQRLEYWQKDLTDTLVTSISVAMVHGHIVAYLGTEDGRHIQTFEAEQGNGGSEAPGDGREGSVTGRPWQGRGGRGWEGWDPPVGVSAPPRPSASPYPRADAVWEEGAGADWTGQTLGLVRSHGASAFR